MGRFRVSEDDDNHQEDDSNPFRAQHVYSSSGEEDDERSGVWRGPLVPLMAHQPQKGRSKGTSNEHDLGGSSIHPPSVSIRRQNGELIVDDEYDTAVQPHRHYYDHDRAPPRPGGVNWLKVCVAVAVAHLLASYGPVAPPAEADSESWEEFWLRELRGLWRHTKLIGYTVPKYVIEWVGVGLYDDALIYYHHYENHMEEQAQLEYWSNCSLKIPREWNLEDDGSNQVEDWYHMVGQPIAVKLTTAALDAWKQSAALLLYFVGGPGVGKLEMAGQISLRLFGHCLGSNNKQFDAKELLQGSGPVMMIQGRDFAMHTEEEEEEVQAGGSKEEDIAEERAKRGSLRVLRVQLYESIIRHTQRHPNGTAIILQHPEYMAEGLLATLVQDLATPSRRFSWEIQLAVNYDKSQSLAARLQQACGKTIFMLTSIAGADAISKAVRDHGGLSAILPADLHVHLEGEFDRNYGTQGTRQASVNLGSKLDALVPFDPLEEPTMKQILAQKASRWTQARSFSRLSITKQALDVLLGKTRLEYNIKQHKKTKEITNIYSKWGAHVLEDGSLIMNSWQASVVRCLRGKTSESDDDDDERDSVPSPETVVLDYDAETSNGVLLRCPADAIHYDPSDWSTQVVNRTNCEEKCQMDV